MAQVQQQVHWYAATCMGKKKKNTFVFESDERGQEVMNYQKPEYKRVSELLEQKVETHQT